MSDCLIDHIWLLFHTIFPFYAINKNLNHRNSRKVHKKGNKCYYDSKYDLQVYRLHNKRNQDNDIYERCGLRCHISFELLWHPKRSQIYFLNLAYNFLFLWVLRSWSLKLEQNHAYFFSCLYIILQLPEVRDIKIILNDSQYVIIWM